MWKNNIRFILIEPQDAGNIGASARAMKNMGFKHLEMVRPVQYCVDETRWLAHNSFDVIEKATVYDTFEDALRDKSIVVGTTRREGKTRGLMLPIKECVKRIVDLASTNTIAFVFGREDRGLTNDEVQRCGYLATIPTHSEQPSLNLAQAVLITAYELSQIKSTCMSDRLVSQDALVPLFERINTTVRLLNYMPKGNRDLDESIMEKFRHLIGRSGLTDWEYNMLLGICTQIESLAKNRVVIS